MRTTAKALKAELHPIEVGGPTEYKSAFSTWANQQLLQKLFDRCSP
jgi:hypothetical protein